MIDVSKPLFFEKNRVFRVYKGGKLFSDFFSDDSEDSFYPEEWIASSVEALNENSKQRKEGVSIISDMGEYFDELLSKHRHDMLGSSGRMRILVKLLDSAVRLPAQVHPDRAFSEKYFNSKYGKTEAWVILGTRENAKIFFGFKDGVDESALRAAIDASEHDKTAMEKLMRSITPRVGDVFLVPAKTVHAIGAGCLILEVQEPTDFTIQPERWCDEYRLSDNEMYLGLDKEDALKCFSYEKPPQARIETEAELLGDGVEIERLINEKHTPCFVINRISLTGGEYKLDVQDSFGVYVVISGEGELYSDDYKRKIKRADYFFLPCCAMGKFKISGNLKFIECY